MLKLSIIIPVYNVEKYIRKCIESCLNQGIPKDEYEIICVDDGSNDTSMAIIEEFAQNYSNIIMLFQPNSGQSAARNHAMRVARGRYVWFVDSDDWLEPCCAIKLLDILESHQLDVLCFTFQYVEEDGRVSPDGYNLRKTNTIMSGKEFIVENQMPAGPWSAIHSRDFLQRNNINYIEGIKREDEDFTIRAYCMAGRIELVDVVAYNYLQRSGSTMKSIANSKTSYDLLVVADSLYSFASNKIEKTSNAYFAVMNRVSFVFSQALAYHINGKPSLSEFRNKPYYPLSINALLSSGNKWKYRLINLSLSVYLLIYKTFKRHNPNLR